MKKKLKLTKSISKEAKNYQKKSLDSNPYFIKIHDNIYIKGEIKYDLSDYDYVDITLIDAILITSLKSLMGLPFLVCNQGFKGNIYATLPICQIGKEILKEFWSLNHSRVKEDSNLNKDYFKE